VRVDKLILVTGGTGYIASRLIPRLLDSGYRVRALARDPRRLAARSWFNKIDIVQAEVRTPSTLAHAFDGVDTAYYFIHNMSYGHGYTRLELEAARNFAKAAEQAGVQHIIYLGGLADPDARIAPHMRSRIETGNVLREGKVPVTEFRAGVIAGSGSISFEMIRFMTELFPIIPGPLWMKNKSQPIAIQNIIDYLSAALNNKSGQGQVFEIGGPEIFTYKDLMLRYAHIRKLKRRMLLLPGLPVWFMAFGVDLMTPVPYPIAHALIDGLSADSIVKHPEALQVFPEVRLIDFDSATQDALEKTHPCHIERMWADSNSETQFVKHEGCFILHGEIKINRETEKIIQTIVNLHKNPPIPMGEGLGVRESLHNPFGKKWIEWRVGRTASPTYLTQTLFFSPRGLPGFLYWILSYPFHRYSFRGLIRKIVKRSQSS
jgi:uncharacterized protein YbjT (DUF2867 family)